MEDKVPPKKKPAPADAPVPAAKPKPAPKAAAKPKPAPKAAAKPKPAPKAAAKPRPAPKATAKPRPAPKAKAAPKKESAPGASITEAARPESVPYQPATPRPWLTRERRNTIIRVAVTVAIAAALLGAYLAPRFVLKSTSTPPPEALVRQLVQAIKERRTSTAEYEKYFADLSVASALADAARRNTLPKGLDIARISSVSKDMSATVTVKWTVARPAIAQNGTAFTLSKKSGKWLILDAVSQQVP
jgi:hypothetical protein